MKVVGEEGTGLEDFVEYLKGEFFDFVYLQQNAFDEVDEATTSERQKYIFEFIYSKVLEQGFGFSDKEQARHFFQKLRQLFRGWNSSKWESKDFKQTGQEIATLISEKTKQKESASA